MLYRYLIATVIVSLAMVMGAAHILAAAQRAEYRPIHIDALCGTDSDCMKLCDDDDIDCDGGPEAAK